MKKIILIVLCVVAASVSAQALTIDQAKRAAARASGYASVKSWKVSIAIVNAEGNLVYFERGDASYPGSIEASIKKAKSAAAFQRPTSAFAEAIKSGRTALLSLDGVVAIEGGVPLMVDGKFAGAIGVSGVKALEDEEVAAEGAKALAQ